MQKRNKKQWQAYLKLQDAVRDYLKAHGIHPIYLAEPIIRDGNGPKIRKEFTVHFIGARSPRSLKPFTEHLAS